LLDTGGCTFVKIFATVKYDTRTMTLFDDDTLSTTESRVRCSLALGLVRVLGIGTPQRAKSAD
jgi:hypothetical protein